MSFIKGILKDLQQRRLWPVPVALIAAIVAVPVVLSKQTSAPAPAPLPSVHGRVDGTPVAAVTVNNSPSNTHPSGSARDPFTQQKQPKATTTTGASSSTATAATSSSAAASAGTTGTGSTSAGGSSAASTPSTGSAGTTPSTPAPSPVAPGAKPTPAPTGLTDKQSYDVSLSITTPAGGLSQTDALDRLSVLPSDKQPLVVELGVLQGGKRVLFAVQPGAVATGGSCTPGPIDCEILSVGQDQIVSVSTQTPTGSVPIGRFAVTGITAHDHGSAAEADKARRKESAAGRKLVDSSSSSALSLFQYDPTIGAVLDLRNLTVGGN